MTSQNNRVPVLCYVKFCALFQSHPLIQTGVTFRKRPIRVNIWDFLALCELQIWWMTLKNNRAPLLCYFKLCVSFHSHCSIQTGVTVRKRPIRVKIDDCLSCTNLKLDRWSWKTIGHLVCATSSFVYHFIAIGQFKLGLQSGNAQFRSKSACFCPVWPRNLMDDLEKRQGTSSMLLHAFCIIS